MYYQDPDATHDPDMLVEVKDLYISFTTPRGELKAVNGISYSVKKGEIMGLVGESGSGKSVEAYSIMGLLPPTAKVGSGSVYFKNSDILSMSKKELEPLRGKEMSMIFQNPTSYLDPVFTIGKQMVETVRAHDKSVSKDSAMDMSLNMLKEVRIRNPEQVMRQYPFELSGWMCQRVMIAIALLCEPELLIADEPTTALDVTTQIQIVQILKRLQAQREMAMIYITHNFGIIAELCDRVSVMYGGYILEQGLIDDIFYHAAHPYTLMLLRTIPRMDSLVSEPLLPIEGAPVDQVSLPDGCVFHPRCPSCMEICRREHPEKTIISPEHSASCWLLSATGGE